MKRASALLKAGGGSHRALYPPAVSPKIATMGNNYMNKDNFFEIIAMGATMGLLFHGFLWMVDIIIK